MHPIALKTLVEVAKRTSPGENKLGGVGTVTFVSTSPDGDFLYNVKYSLGGTESLVASKYVNVHTYLEPSSRSRRNSAPSHPPSVEKDRGAVVGDDFAPLVAKKPRRRETTDDNNKRQKVEEQSESSSIKRVDSSSSSSSEIDTVVAVSPHGNRTTTSRKPDAEEEDHKAACAAMLASLFNESEVEGKISLETVREMWLERHPDSSLTATRLNDLLETLQAENRILLSKEGDIYRV